MLDIEINGQQLAVPDGSTVMDAANQAGVYIPHFCYHKKLSIAANCRMCLVEVEKAPKPLPACATPVTDGMKVKTGSELAAKAQQGVMEFLLINHPLDCPICDQGGECQLQDLAVGYGGSSSRYQEEKRAVGPKDIGPLVSAEEMSRCIHCTRCVRFGQEIAGVMELGMINRGEHSEIVSFVGKSVDSELSGNMIDLCPVGALTSKPFRYAARTWELSRRKSVSPHDGLGSNLIVQVKQNKVYRVLPLENEDINECWLSDRDRFSYEAVNSESRLTQPMIKHGGAWHEVDWQTALDYVVKTLSDIKGSQGAGAIGGLISPQSTLEELYLFQAWLRGIGVNNIDHRLRQSDFSVDATPWLGMGVPEIGNAEAILLIGSNIRKEHPLLAARVRHAAKHGAKVGAINSVDYDHLLKLAAKSVVAPSKLVAELAGVVKALADASGQRVGEQVAAAANAAVVSEAARQIAAHLQVGERRVILLGNQAQHHPRYAQLLALANEAARLINGKVGVLVESANGVGAHLAGALPSKGVFGAAVAAGEDAGSMLASPKAAYVLFNAEPEADSYRGAQALAALQAAKSVVVFSAFKSAAAMDYADVLLPISPFTETAGSFVSMEGRVQPFNGVVKPQGDARPGWKVLRVLGNLFGLSGFEFNAAEEVRATLLQGKNVAAQLNNTVSQTVSLEAAGEGVERIGAILPYHADPLVRRAPALAETVDAREPRLLARADVLARFGLAEGQVVRVRQGDAVVELIAEANERIADGCVDVAGAHPKTALLGGLFDTVQLERA